MAVLPGWGLGQESTVQEEETMFQLLPGDWSEFAPRLDAGVVWPRVNNQQEAALPWPHGFLAVFYLKSHSRERRLQVEQEAGQNSDLPAFHKNMWHGCLRHKLLGVPWKALEVGIFAFLNRRASYSTWVPGSLRRTLRPWFPGTHPGFIEPEACRMWKAFFEKIGYTIISTSLEVTEWEKNRTRKGSI